MASSTTIPSTKIKPNKLITLSVIPKIGIIKNAPINDTGMPINTQNAMAGRKNKVSSARTKIPP